MKKNILLGAALLCLLGVQSLQGVKVTFRSNDFGQVRLKIYDCSHKKELFFDIFAGDSGKAVINVNPHTILTLSLSYDWPLIGLVTYSTFAKIKVGTKDITYTITDVWRNNKHVRFDWNPEPDFQ